MEFTIKPIQLSQLETFYNLFQKVLTSEFPEYSENLLNIWMTKDRYWSKNKYKKAVQENSKILLGAFQGEEIIGLLHADKPYGGVSFCVWLMVDPNFQGKGIGTQLIKEWEVQVLENKGHMQMLTADKRNIEYYKSLGFKQTQYLEKGWFGQNEYTMTKLIAEPSEDNY